MTSLAEHLLELSGLPRADWNYVVLGNESGDLDSVASALCYSFLKKPELVIPILNFPKADLKSKKELIYLFNEWGIPLDVLYFKEDLTAFRGEAVLVDHRWLAIDQRYLKPLVRRILDHHPGSSDPFPHLIEEEIVLCGSNATLVAAKKEDWPKDAAAFLLGAILLDTNCLENPHKTTELDRKMAQSLAESAALDCRSFYEELLRLKEDVQDEDLLKRDAKSYSEGRLVYAISSIPRKLAFDREAWEKFRKERQVHALFVFINKAESRSKSLFLYTPDGKLLEQMIKQLPFKLVHKEENMVQFLCPEALSRKTLQPQFSFADPSIQTLLPL